RQARRRPPRGGGVEGDERGTSVTKERRELVAVFAADVERRATRVARLLVRVRDEDDPVRRESLLDQLSHEAHDLLGGARTLQLGEVEELAEGLFTLLDGIADGAEVDDELL